MKGHLMKAIVVSKYGPPEGLQLRDIEKPSPKDDEVLVKVHAGSVTAGDVMLRKATFPLTLVLRMFGVRRKCIPGHELAGEVEAVGKHVTRFKPGDRVFGTTTGLTVGANAEYVAVPETSKSGTLAPMPDTMDYDEAAGLPVGSMTALYILQQAGIKPGEKVLVYGASGSVGSFAVQLARHFGAAVTGVASTANLEMVKSLGADNVIDYKKEDFRERGDMYDVIFDAVGKTSAAESKGVLKEDGRFVGVRSTTHERVDNLRFIKELAEAGELRAVIDRRYPLAEVAAAHRYVETGRKRGNVVITVANGRP
jgi:2-desacetyl-2-hydroxyethyl bacteriochlorophyllide A dehydrogenase